MSYCSLFFSIFCIQICFYLFQFSFLFFFFQLKFEIFTLFLLHAFRISINKKIFALFYVFLLFSSASAFSVLFSFLKYIYIGIGIESQFMQYKESPQIYIHFSYAIKTHKDYLIFLLIFFCCSLAFAPVPHLLLLLASFATTNMKKKRKKINKKT